MLDPQRPSVANTLSGIQQNPCDEVVANLRSGDHRGDCRPVFAVLRVGHRRGRSTRNRGDGWSIQVSDLAALIRSHRVSDSDALIEGAMSAATRCLPQATKITDCAYFRIRIAQPTIFQRVAVRCRSSEFPTVAHWSHSHLLVET